jgi:ubiquinone/menaquinone biosynthesis C-methylase UbiE
MTRDIDLLTSPALTHLRDRWWDASFTAFVRDTLRPRPGEHVLEVGCGAGIADLMLGLLEPGSVRYCGIDLKPARVREARGAARDHGLRLELAVADVRGIPFRDATFECTFAIGVLQHVAGAAHAVAELARVTRPDGRVLLVEPDNANRYWFSSLESGRRAFDASTRFFAAREKETREKETRDQATRDRETPAQQDKPGRERAPERERIDRSLGPHLFALCRAAGIDGIGIHMFPVTRTRLGAPVSTVWEARRRAIARAVEEANGSESRALGRDLIDAIDRYAEEGAAAGASFVEIQNTMLFALVGHRRA